MLRETLKLTAWLLGWLAILVFLNLLIKASPMGRDDSDESGWFGKRSGVTPVSDRLTGCQYLITDDGGITPRLDATGAHICAKGE